MKTFRTSILGVVAPLSGWWVSLQRIEPELQLLSLCIGIVVGLLSIASLTMGIYARVKRYKKL